MNYLMRRHHTEMCSKRKEDALKPQNPPYGEQLGDTGTWNLEARESRRVSNQEYARQPLKVLKPKIWRATRECWDLD